MAQLDYNYSTAKNVPGGKADLSFDEVVTRQNESADGVLKYGMGVAIGSTAGKTVKVPATTSDKFEGVVLSLPNTEQDMNGKVIVKKGASLSIIKKGHVWARTATDAVVTYGAKAYLAVDGEDVGTFTSATASVTAYVKCDSTTTSAKQVVSDSVSSPTSSQVKLSSVTPRFGFTPVIGDYVVQKKLHGTTVDVGATFGNETDDGIAIIEL